MAFVYLSFTHLPEFAGISYGSYRVLPPHSLSSANNVLKFKSANLGASLRFSLYPSIFRIYIGKLTVLSSFPVIYNSGVLVTGMEVSRVMTYWHSSIITIISVKPMDMC